MKLSGVSILQNRRENLKLNVVFIVGLVLESKALYLQGMRCNVYDIAIVRPYEYDKREFSNNSTHTLGARGFSCAVSGFGQVLKSNPCENVRTRVGLRPTKRSSPFTREKNPLVPRVLNSGTVFETRLVCVRKRRLRVDGPLHSCC